MNAKKKSITTRATSYGVNRCARAMARRPNKKTMTNAVTASMRYTVDPPAAVPRYVTRAEWSVIDCKPASCTVLTMTCAAPPMNAKSAPADTNHTEPARTMAASASKRPVANSGRIPNANSKSTAHRSP